MGKRHGHYCRICGQHKANEKFSGRGHAVHICKACARRGNKPPDVKPDVPFIEDEEAFFGAYEFPLDTIPTFDFEGRASMDAPGANTQKTGKPRKKRKPVKKMKVKPTEKIRAKEFLSKILADGAKPKNGIIEAAEQIGITLHALRKAKGSLGIRSEATADGSVWFMPPQDKD